MSQLVSAPPQPAALPAASGLLSLSECEDAIVQLLELSASVCAALSEVHEDPVLEVAPTARQFHVTLRLVYASLLAHIRSHAGEVHLHGAGGAGGVGAGHGGSIAAAGASSAREYRRNVYLDTQHMSVLMESMAVVKQRIEEAQQETQQQQRKQQGQVQQQQQQQQQQQDDSMHA